MARATFNSARGKPCEVSGWPKALLDYRLTRQFTFLQLHEIAEGLRHRLDVSVYANPTLDHHQMHVLRIGMQNGLPVGDLAQSRAPWLDMLLVLEKRGDGLAYEPGAQKEKRLLMPSLREMERMLLQEPQSEPEAAREDVLDFQEILDSLPDDMRAYLDGIFQKENDIESDIGSARAAVAERAFVGSAVHALELG